MAKVAAKDKPSGLSGTERVEKLLALLVLESIGKKSDKEKSVLLNRIGFDNQEVGTLIGTSAAVVSQHLYEVRKSKTTKKPAKKTAKKAAKRTKKS